MPSCLTTKSSSSTIDRRRFLTVLGVPAPRGRAGAERLLDATGCRSWCPIWCSRRTRCPASPPGTRAPAPSAPTGAGSTCAPARAARSSSRATPSTRSTRASSAPAARRAPGALQPRADQARRWRVARTAASRRSPGTTRSRGSRRKLGPRPGGGSRSSRARVAGRSPISWPSGPRRWAGGWSATRPSTTSRMRAANRQVFGLDQVPAHDFARAKLHRLLRRGLPGYLGLASIENARGFARSHGFGESDVAKLVYAGPRMDLTGLNADQWHADHAGLRGRARAGDGERAA